MREDSLQDELTRDGNIRIEPVTDWNVLLNDGNRNVPREGNPRLHQLVA